MVFLPELLPSELEGMGDTPFDEFDAEQLALLGRWLERAAPRWPVRRSRRTRAGRSGDTIALRASMAASGRAGFEPLLDLRWQRRVVRPRPLTLVTDVSASMQSYSAAYLHLMRAFARTGRSETFAFSTSLTRLTPALVHRSADTALALAEERVVDRYGGTHLARSLRDLLASRHGSTLRGGVLVIASDGWDTDDPSELSDVMARLKRRVRRLVWLNPRAGAHGFEPLVGSMAAALPYCDAFLPGPHGDRAARRLRGGQLQSVTCTAGRNRPWPAASPRIIACVARGVPTNRISSAPTDGQLVAAQRPGRPRPAARQLRRLDGHEPAVAQVVADGEPDGDGEALPAPRLGERRRVALVDPLPLLGDAEPAQHLGGLARRLHRARAEVPDLVGQLLLAQLPGHRGMLGRGRRPARRTPGTRAAPPAVARRWPARARRRSCGR